MTELARYVMIGGFLGAGKTTALAKLGAYLVERGQRVGLICNDQSMGLVDTAFLRSAGFRVEEITGGCFCCRFHSLMEAADRLTAEATPDLFLAEPVGSCTDLVATVSYPLRRIYGERFRVAPLSVLVDPARAARVLGLRGGRRFSEKVRYVYTKQLEEADIIVINKVDEAEPALLDALEETLRVEYPRAALRRVSAKQGTGLADWFDSLLAGEVEGEALTIDYDTYAEGEALLGWLNCTVQLAAEGLFDADQVLLDLAGAIQAQVADIAHLKMTLDPLDGSGTLSVVSVVRDDAGPDLRASLLDRTERGELVINLRAEADPERLERAVRAALEALPLTVTVDHLERLRPARPVPTYRMT